MNGYEMSEEERTIVSLMKGRGIIINPIGIISILDPDPDDVASFAYDDRIDVKIEPETQRAMEWLAHIDSLHLEGGFAEILGWKYKADLFEKLFGDIDFEIVSKEWLDSKLEKAELFDKMPQMIRNTELIKKLEAVRTGLPNLTGINKAIRDAEYILNCLNSTKAQIKNLEEET